MIGFLSPSGEFIECNSWEHTSVAGVICLQAYDIDKCGIQAEDYILSKGYLVIRARDVYMSYWDTNGCGKTLSKEQLNWILENKNNFNEMQKEDINDILLFNKRLGGSAKTHKQTNISFKE